MVVYLAPCSCSSVTGDIARRACIEIVEKRLEGKSRMLGLAFYARSLATGDRLILGSSLADLKAGEVICVNGCSMECAAKILQALGVTARHSFRLMDELPGIKLKGKLSEITPADVQPVVDYIMGKMGG